MGGGVFGLAAAWACARRGARVELREVRRIGAGASGGLVGALAPHAPDGWTEAKAFQLRALLMAEDWWAEVAAAGGGDPGYARTGRVQPLADAAAVARAEARIAEAARHWGTAARWEVRPADALPGLRVASASGRVVFDTLSARLHPRHACAALAAALVARGGQVVEGSDAPEGEGPVIWATGWEGLAALSDDLGRNVDAGVKGQALLLAHAARDAPQLSAPGLHVVPHADGTTAIGSTSETGFDAPDTTDAQLDAVLARAVTLCPDLGSAPVLARWAGVRPRARSRAPVLGAWPGRPGRYLANGGFKIGFALAPLAGELIADLVLEGRDAIPPAFRPESL
jgi:glycine/D-amino acid oxidase-like deaminating enzyme